MESKPPVDLLTAVDEVLQSEPVFLMIGELRDRDFAELAKTTASNSHLARCSLAGSSFRNAV